MRTIIKPHFSIGDIVATAPYVDRLRSDTGDIVYYEVNDELIPLLKPSYPDVNFLGRGHAANEHFFDRTIPLNYIHKRPVQAGFAMQLGYPDAPYIRPRVTAPNLPRPMRSRYVCIGVHSTMQLKYWNHPGGRASQPTSPNWDELCGMIRKRGLVPVVLEKNELYGWRPEMNGIPRRANRKIGLGMTEAVNFIYHCEFYVGLSSGMSWVAHALGKRVAMIANFASPENEFGPSDDFVRIDDRSVCNGCWSEEQFDGMDWYWCPRHQGTKREFECHKSISPQRVFSEIEKWIADD